MRVHKIADRAVGPGQPPLVAHIIYRLGIGGLENGLVNLINRLPNHRYRHAIICLTNYTEFRTRIQRADIQVFALNKREGKDLAVYLKLWRLLRRLRPDIVHTRNLAALEGVVIAALAGVPHRVHGEHGRDMIDLHGHNRKYNLLRRFCKPFVHQYIALSHDLALWLRDKIAVPDYKVTQIYNGVDVESFHPQDGNRALLPRRGFAHPRMIVIGTVGRLAPVKDPLTLVNAFIRLLDMVSDSRKRLRLVLVGNGPLSKKIAALLKANDAMNLVWLADARDDVPQMLRSFDIFALSSLAEGISNTILEAMASGLPVVATRVGGTPELVTEGVTGLLVPPGDPIAMAHALNVYVEKPRLMKHHGSAARKRVERDFGIDRMVRRYEVIYDQLLARG